jgi:hypothetical protein
MSGDESRYLTAKVDVGLVSDAQFNVVTHLEGPHNRFLRYIEEQSNCRLSVHGALHFGADAEDEGPLHILVLAETEDGLEKARTLCENLVATVRAQRQQMVQQRAAKRIKKKKAGKGMLVLPDQLIAAMRVYCPAGPAEPPPPGSPEDVREHARSFRAVGRRLGWFAA